MHIGKLKLNFAQLPGLIINCENKLLYKVFQIIALLHLLCNVGCTNQTRQTSQFHYYNDHFKPGSLLMKASLRLHRILLNYLLLILHNSKTLHLVIDFKI